jgi:hypothetical protein
VGLLGAAILALPQMGLAQHTPNIAEQYLLTMANQERAQRGVQPLTWDAHLAAAALWHAQRMSQENTVSHQFAGEPDMTARAKSAGTRFSLVAENVAIADTPESLHTLWMNSAGHRENLLEPHENAIGIAVVRRGNNLYAVEDFAELVGNESINQQESEVAKQLLAAGMKDVVSTEDARQTCGMDTGYAGTRKPYFIMRYTTTNLAVLPQELKIKLANDHRIHHAVVGACAGQGQNFALFNVAVLLYP